MRLCLLLVLSVVIIPGGPVLPPEVDFPLDELDSVPKSPSCGVSLGT